MSEISEVLEKQFGATDVVEEGKEVTLKVSPERLHDAVAYLKDAGFDFLATVTAVDYENNFQVINSVRSLTSLEIVNFVVDLPKDSPSIASLADLYVGANIQEREVYDLMGITFEGHPNLKRVLLTDDFVGHPLRKDYKLEPWEPVEEPEAEEVEG